MKQKNLLGKIILSIVSGIIFTSIYFYIELPAINPASPSFWGSLTMVVFSFAYPFLLKKGDGVYRMNKSAGKHGETMSFEINGSRFNKITVALILIPSVIMLAGSVISSMVFNARAYAKVIEVTEADFATDMKETNEVTNIALMDGNSARYLGNKTLGSVSHMVSQYVVSDRYTQINYQYTPKKVANLEHADFFKWFANKDKGVPGYVMVDPVNNSAEYMELKTPLKYVDSAYFNHDLMRKLRFEYPTKISALRSMTRAIPSTSSPASSPRFSRSARWTSVKRSSSILAREKVKFTRWKKFPRGSMPFIRVILPS